MNKEFLNRCIVFISMMGLFSCGAEISCNENPEIDTDQTKLESEINQIENYLEGEGIEYETHSSGIRYTMIESGTGNSPNFCSNFSADYEGRKLGSDEIFISDIGGQFSMRSNELVPGFKIAINLMNRNAEYKFFIPAQLLINKGIANSVPKNIPTDENVEFRVRLTSY